MFGSNYSAGMETDVSILKKNGQDHTKWTNPLEVREYKRASQVSST